MYIKQIVIAAAILLNKLNVVKYIEKKQAEGDAKDMADKLTRLVILVIGELAMQGVYVIKTQNFFVYDGKVQYTSLRSKPYKILKIEDEQGNEYPFETFAEYFVTDKRASSITYAYGIQNETLDSKIVFSEYQISESIIANAVAAEYLLTVNEFESAVTFHDKFVKGIEGIRKVKNTKVKERSFV
jgi:hypothetical protein